MTWRKWLIRGLVCSVLAGLALVFLVYYLYTNPAATRLTVLSKLGEKFVGASISLQSARLNLLDGISLSELRMNRRDDLDKTDFLYVPSAVIYHDKEQLLNGKLALRKIVLNRPQLRILLDRNGRCNLTGLLGPVNPNELVPTLVFQQGTIVIEDRRLPGGKPILELRNVNLTICNDPLTTLVVDGAGLTDVLGPLQIHADAQRVGGIFTGKLELPLVPIGPLLVQRLREFLPDAAGHLERFQALGKVQVRVGYQPKANPPLALNLVCQVNKGRLAHERLPFPLENIEASLNLVNDPTLSETGEPAVCALLNLRVPSAQVAAEAGSTRLEASLKDLVLPRFNQYPGENGNQGEPNIPPGGGPPSSLPFRFEELPAREFNWKVEHLAVTPDLFKYLPENCRDFRDDYKPCGPITIIHAYRRSKPGSWSKYYSFQPEGMEAECAKFPYPVHGITGLIERRVEHRLGSDHSNRFDFDLAGVGGERPVTLKGWIEGERTTSGVELEIKASDVPMDEQLQRALPPKNQAVAAQFHPEGKADIKALIHRTRGTRDFTNRFEVAVHDASLKYELFPYPLQQVRGVVEIYPDYWVCRNFRGVHRDGEILLEGRSFPPTPEMVKEAAGKGSTSLPPSKVRLVITGKDVLMNKEFEDSLAPPSVPGRAALLRTVRTLAVTGRINFSAEVIDKPLQPRDLEVLVSVHDCRMKPRFFEYALTDVSGSAHYQHDKVEIRDLQARHGNTRLAVKKGKVLVTGENSFYVDFTPDRVEDGPILDAEQILADADLLAALPPVLRRGLACLNIKGPINLRTNLVVDQKDNNKPPVVWWDGRVSLANNSLNAGVDLTGLNGMACCCGRFDGQQIEGLVGDVLFEKAAILGQPVSRLHTHVEVAPDTPQVLRFRNLTGDWFGGQVGGQARVELGNKLTYDLEMLVTQINLEQFAQHNLGQASDMQGFALVNVHLFGNGTEITDLEGHGTVKVPTGKLFRLPVFLDLLKFIGLRAPDKTTFEQAHIEFAVKNGKMQVHRLDLVGNAISLRGAGTANLDGTSLDLDFHSDWGRFHEVVPAPLYVLPQTIGDQLLKIKVRGKIGDVHFEKELMPIVTDTWKGLFGAKP